MGDLYLALIHHPVLDKNGAVVTTAVTNMDVHDIARLARPFGVRRYYVCTPVPTLQRLVERIILHWEEGPGAVYNETRKDALAVVQRGCVPELGAVLHDCVDVDDRAFAHEGIGTDLDRAGVNAVRQRLVAVDDGVLPHDRIRTD